MQQEKSGRYELQIESASHVLLEMPAIMEGGEVYEKYENIWKSWLYVSVFLNVCQFQLIKSMFFFCGCLPCKEIIQWIMDDRYDHLIAICHDNDNMSDR